MLYYTPSTPTIERSPPVRDSTPTIVCFSCGDTMKHFRTISKLGILMTILHLSIVRLRWLL